MSYVLRRQSDGWYVTEPGSRRSYSPSPRRARRYATADSAARDACGNERIEHAPDTGDR